MKLVMISAIEDRSMHSAKNVIEYQLAQSVLTSSWRAWVVRTFLSASWFKGPMKLNGICEVLPVGGRFMRKYEWTISSLFVEGVPNMALPRLAKINLRRVFTQY
jgi:hypothetical protein